MAVTAILSIPLVVAAEDGNDTEFIFTLDSDTESWMVGFADLPVDYDQSIYELDHAHRPLPDGLEGSGVYVQGHNRSDDLFMFLKRRVEGLRPGAEYKVFASVDLATNVQTGLFGIGGSPGESVFVKAGASAVEPVTVVDDNQYLRMNIDKGNQSRGGESMIVIGNVAHPDVLDREYRIKTLDNANMSLTVNADEEGRVWLVVGTDSGFEGLSAFYYSRISYQLSIVEPPATMTPESVPTPAPTSMPTPVATEKVVVDPVVGATVIQPDERVKLSAGSVKLTFPKTSRPRTYQVVLAESEECGGDALACASVSIHNAEGDVEPEARFIFPVEISVVVGPDTIDDLGGPPVALQAYVMDAITLRIRDDVGREWSEVLYEIDFDENGGMNAVAQVRRLGDIALNVNADGLEKARTQVSEALGTQTAAPIPTATPVPTATAVPTATPTLPDPPVTGDSPVPFGMLLALVVAAVLMILTGLRILTTRRV
ncbi:MAG: hypothetical protein F4Y49_11700 [Dehalococcoidia bacterium]|nr:hypothetical protein [Dehalococcoidia bacterium]